MKNRQLNKLRMFRVLEKILNDNGTLWNSIPGFVNIKNAFSAKIISIHSASQQQLMVLTGIAIDKKAAKRTMVDSAMPIIGALTALACQTGNNQLLEDLRFSRTKLLKIRDNSLATRCQRFSNHAADNAAALIAFGITPQQLTAFQNAITNFINVTPSTRSATVRKTTITTNIAKLFSQTETLLKFQLDPLMLQFKIPQVTFFNTYTAARQIIDLGSTSTRLRVLVTDRFGNPLSGSVVSLLQNNTIVYTLSSNAKGKISMHKLKPGIYDLKIEKPGLRTQIQSAINFIAGKEVHRTIHLLPSFS